MLALKKTFVQTPGKAAKKTCTLKNRTIAIVLCSRVKVLSSTLNKGKMRFKAKVYGNGQRKKSPRRNFRSKAISAESGQQY